MRNEGTVSFVIPVRNGERWLDAVLDAVLAQDRGAAGIEVLLVEDGSDDRSAEIAAGRSDDPRIRVLPGPRRGAAAAVNLGFRQAAGRIVCQVDQDVVLDEGWLTAILPAFADDRVAAVQGVWVADLAAPPLVRIATYDVLHRWERVPDGITDHVCTGHTAYRASAVAEVGLLDESMGYGYDNDLSYRLGAAGYRLRLCRHATSVHQWRRGLCSYLRQQYGLGYGRLEVVNRHPDRLRGDRVSGPGMILHVPAMLAVLAGAASGAWAAAFGGPLEPSVVAAGLLAALAAERSVAAVRPALRHRDPSALLMVPLHLLRDVVWVGATLTWAGRRLLGTASRPEHSMRARRGARHG